MQTVDHELVVVDNGSTDGTAAWVRSALPSARLVVLRQNLGFVGGNNVGLRVARGDLVVLLNNDTIAPPSFLAELTAPMARAADVGAVAGVLLFAHRPEVVASAGIVVGRDGVHRDALGLKQVADLPSLPQESFGASGGAACLRREALADVGLFEERFFSYLEDADLAWRMRLRGWRCLLAPSARVRHVYSATAGHHSPAKQRLLALNRWRVLVRCVPGQLLRDCAVSILRYDLLATVYAATSRKPEIVRGRMEAFGELPRLLAERREIAGRASADQDTLAAWLTPALPARQILAEARELDRLLPERPARNDQD